MKFEVFNEVFFEKKVLEKTLQEIFPQKNTMTVNVVFVSKKRVKDLNKDFRGKDEITDVLSFEISQDISEVYICSDFTKQEQETIRMIIHGVLHILGYKHENYFNEENISEEMFEIQERLLTQFYDILEK